MIFYGDIVGDCEDFWIVTGIYFLIFLGGRSPVLGGGCGVGAPTVGGFYVTALWML